MDNDNKKQINPSWNLNENPGAKENQEKPDNISNYDLSSKKIGKNDSELIDPFEEAEKKAGVYKQSKTTETPDFGAKPIISNMPAMPAEEKMIEKAETPPMEIKEKDKTAPIEKKLEEPVEINKPREISTKLQEEKVKPSPAKSILKTIGLFAGILAVLYFSINASGYLEKIKFFFNPPKISAEESSLYIKESVKENFIKPGTTNEIYVSFFQTAIRRPINYIPPANESASTKQESEETNANESARPAVSSDLPNNTLYLPRLGKKVPIVWNSPPDEQVMLENLQKGVVHYAGTPLPGQGKGPIFISGHSSYYSWDPGKYKSVFANLDKMENGDEIMIQYEGALYRYKVYEKIVVTPEEVSVLKPIDEPVLALMTCVPVGTNSKRLIVWAKEF